MVKITNGVNVFEVTRGAFDGIYSHQGYSVISNAEDEIVTEQDEVVAEEEVSEDDLFCNELVERPIAQWNKEEVKRFAEIKKVDISGTKNANEAKEIIKAFLDSQE